MRRTFGSSGVTCDSVAWAAPWRSIFPIAAAVWTTVEVSGLDKLSRVLHRLEGIKDVFSVMREVGKAPANGRA